MLIVVTTTSRKLGMTISVSYPASSFTIEDMMNMQSDEDLIVNISYESI